MRACRTVRRTIESSGTAANKIRRLSIARFDPAILADHLTHECYVAVLRQAIFGSIRIATMSAIGTEQTSKVYRSMSALRGRADVPLCRRTNFYLANTFLS
jgi:hypothetical protein